MVVSGSCLCRNPTYDIEGDEDLKPMFCNLPLPKLPQTLRLHANLLIPTSSLTNRGTPKVCTRTGDSSKDVSINFCDNCGHSVLVTAELYPDVAIVKAGTIDDEKWLSARAPVREIYCKDRMEWLPQIAEVALSKT